MTAIERRGELLSVHVRGTEDDHAATLTARRALLAVGVRGTPRKLPLSLSPELEAKVFYHLADARSWAGRRVVVVGLGDVAMECAIALAHQPSTTVTVIHRGEGFSRGKSRNVAEVERLLRVGRLELVFRAELRTIARDHVVLDVAGQPRHLPNDVVFVMIGSEPPHALLKKAGVEIGVAV